MSDQRDSDPFRPPEIPVEVLCIECGREYESYLIEWRVERIPDGQMHGFWCCPTPGCSGAGFGFDILPVDSAYHDLLSGWVDADDEDGEFDEDFDDECDFDESAPAGGCSDLGLLDPDLPRPPGDDELFGDRGPRWLSDDDDVPF